MKTPFLQLFTVLLATVILSLALNPQTQAGTKNNEHAAFERIRKTRHIKCGYIIWPPYVMKDPNTGEIAA